MANDFTTDPNCCALWRWESGSLLVDSIGSNDWSFWLGSPTADGVNYKEGSYSGRFAGNNGVWVDDVDLDAGFPLKNGDSKKEISVCGWIRLDHLPSAGAPDYGWAVIFAKCGTNQQQFALFVHSSGDVYMATGYNFGTQWEYHHDVVSNVQANQWYHIFATYRDSDKAYYMKTWDDNAGTSSDISGTGTNAINIEDGAIRAGYIYTTLLWGYLDGVIDELVIFNDILTEGEGDQIRQGNYAGAVSANDLMLGANF